MQVKSSFFLNFPKRAATCLCQVLAVQEGIHGSIGHMWGNGVDSHKGETKQNKKTALPGLFISFEPIVYAVHHVRSAVLCSKLLMSVCIFVLFCFLTGANQLTCRFYVSFFQL